MNPCATILALCFTTSLFSILFPEENWCRYCLWIPSHYWARSFLPRLYPLLEFSPSVVHTLPWPWSLDLNHLKGFCNLVEKCMSTICRLPVIWFSRIYISIYSWWKYRYPWWLLAISQCDRVRYSDVLVIVCTMTWVGGGFPSTGCILPNRCLSTWSWLVFTDSQALISLLAGS